MKILIQNKFWEINKDYNKEKLLYLLIDRPNEIDSYGDYTWYNNKGRKYRDYDLPSNIWNNGPIFWIINNKLHRANDKPAIVYKCGQKEYFLNNKYVNIKNNT